MKVHLILLLFFSLLTGCSVTESLIPYWYDNGPDMPSEGLVRVKDKSGKIGYAETNGNIVISPRFAFAYPFKNGQAKVTFEGKLNMVPESNGELHYWQSERWYCIDRSGWIVSCKNSID